MLSKIKFPTDPVNNQTFVDSNGVKWGYVKIKRAWVKLNREIRKHKACKHCKCVVGVDPAAPGGDKTAVTVVKTDTK